MKTNRTQLLAWLYKGVAIFPATINGSGIKWTANAGYGHTLRADTKQNMRELINQHRKIAQ